MKLQFVFLILAGLILIYICRVYVIAFIFWLMFFLAGVNPGGTL